MSKWIIRTTLVANQPVYYAAMIEELEGGGVRGLCSPYFLTEAEAKAFADKHNQKEEKNDQDGYGNT